MIVSIKSLSPPIYEDDIDMHKLRLILDFQGDLIGGCIYGNFEDSLLELKAGQFLEVEIKNNKAGNTVKLLRVIDNPEDYSIRTLSNLF